MSELEESDEERHVLPSMQKTLTDGPLLIASSWQSIGHSILAW